MESGPGLVRTSAASEFSRQGWRRRQINMIFCREKIFEVRGRLYQDEMAGWGEIGVSNNSYYPSRILNKPTRAFLLGEEIKENEIS